MASNNMKCSICNYEWHVRGHDVEDLLCFRCQGYLPDKDGKIPNEDELNELVRRITSRAHGYPPES